MAYREGELWVAVCLDLCLGAQDTTPHGAQKKLAAQIRDYVSDAINDEAYGNQLLARKAPVSLWVRYYYYKLRLWLKNKGGFKPARKVGKIGHGKHSSIVFEQDPLDCCPA